MHSIFGSSKVAADVMVQEFSLIKEVSGKEISYEYVDQEPERGSYLLHFELVEDQSTFSEVENHQGPERDIQRDSRGLAEAQAERFDKYAGELQL